MKTTTQNNQSSTQDTVVKIAAIITGLFIAGFAYAVLFVHGGNIN